MLKVIHGNKYSVQLMKILTEIDFLKLIVIDQKPSLIKILINMNFHSEKRNLNVVKLTRL